MKNPFTSIKDKITQYFDLQIQTLKLSILSQMAKVMGYLAFVFVLFIFGVILCLFLCIAGAISLGHLIGGIAAGFLAFAGFVLLVLIIMGVFAKRVIGFFADKSIMLLTIGQDDEPEEVDTVEDVNSDDEAYLESENN